MLRNHLFRFEAALDAFMLAVVFAVANRASWLCVFEKPNALFSCGYGSATDELLLYLLVAGVVMWLVYRRKQQNQYWALWKRNWILVLFLALGFVSLVWSIEKPVTLYKSLLVSSSAMVAAYFGVRYEDGNWVQIIAFFGILVMLLSYLLVAILPGVAIMSSVGLVGDWRGAFSHKNYMGAIVAYCSAILLYVLLTDKRNVWRILFNAVVYLLSVGLIFMSKSATGLVLFVLLSGFTIGWLAYRKRGRSLTRWHYLLLGVISVGLALTAWLNLDRILTVLGRSPDLTGRVPFWMYLIEKARTNHVWLGYGMGALWYDWGFRAQAEYDLHGSFPVINAHNGFIEVFLSLGVIGLVIFLAVILLIIYRLFRCAQGGSRSVYWGALTTIYVVIVNITTSFFFQFETFHWVLLVAVLFMATRAERDQPSALSGEKSRDREKLMRTSKNSSGGTA